MKSVSKFLAAGAVAALALAASSANAAVYIRVVNSGGTFDSAALPDSSFAFVVGTGAANSAGGGFDLINVAGSSVTGSSLHSNTIESNASGAATTTIYVTRTDMTGDFHKLKSVFNFSSTGGLPTITSTNYVSFSNLLFTGTQFASASFTATDPDTDGAVFKDLDYIDLSATPYSFTEKYVLSTPGATTIQSSSTITGTVPEPGTWALMIMGFGGAGAMLRSRRRALAAV